MTDEDNAGGGTTGPTAEDITGYRNVYSRRRLLAAAGATGGALVAGCLGDDSGSGDDPEERGAGGDAGGTSGDGEMASTDETDAAGDMASTDGMDATDEMGTTDGMESSENDADETDGGGMAETTSGNMGDEDSMAAWETTELEPVRDGEPFTVAELESPVIVQTFAVWCPKCQRQQEALQGVSDEVTVVSLNVDSNEGGDQVASHANDNGFGWRFAVAPSEVTQSLIDEFGTDVATPPSSPLVVRCGDGSTEFRSGDVLGAPGIRSVLDEC